MTNRLSAYVNASPKLSNAPDNNEDEPLIIAAETIIKKVAALITRTMIRMRRWRVCSAETSKSLWQQLSLTRKDSAF
jgi:hypothetical protein